MKNWIGILVVTIFLGFTPQAVLAESNDTALKQRLLAQIEILQKQLAALLQMQAELPDPEMQASLRVYKSRFYDGDYEALYYVDDTELKRRDGKMVREGDQVLWDAYLAMVGKEFVDDNISEFRVFNDEENLLTGYVDQKMDLSWVFAINRFGDNFKTDYNQDFTVELLLHESAHIAFFNDLSYEKDFIDEFWETSAANSHERRLSAARNLNDKTKIAEDYYNTNPNYFVTDYAATSPTEDLVESFVEFVARDYPQGKYLKDEKVRFFYNYPELRDWREELRDSALVKAAF